MMNFQRDRISISGISAKGYHGVFEPERRCGQLFTADIVLHTSTRAAGRSDDLADTIDYGAVAELIHQIIAGEPVNLVEALAERIARRVLAEFAKVSSVEVTVHKPMAPIGVSFQNVAVTICRHR